MKKFIVALVAMIATSTVSFGQSYNYNSRRNATYLGDGIIQPG